MAPEVYWGMRESASNCREWLMMAFAGSRTTDTWRELWLVAESVDLTLNQTYSSAPPGYGMHAVAAALQGDDRLEHWLSRIAAEEEFQRTGERSMREAMMSSRPPGLGHIAPTWARSAALDESRAAYLQAGRVAGRGRGAEAAQGLDGNVDGTGARRPRRRPKAGAAGGGDGGRGAGRG